MRVSYNLLWLMINKYRANHIRGCPILRNPSFFTFQKYALIFFEIGDYITSLSFYFKTKVHVLEVAMAAC